MPFSSEQISYAGRLAMDFIMGGKPEDIYNIDRPLMKLLRANQKSFPGGKQYVVQKLRTGNDSNFQWFAPDGEVSYNRKRTISEAQFAWGSCHDGFALTEEELLQNGISVVDNAQKQHPTKDEKLQFVNILTENTETLKLGFQEKFDYELHLDGTQDADAIPGLDLLVSTTPLTGTVGGINRANVSAWRNYSSGATLGASGGGHTTGIAATAGVLLAEMERAWRANKRVGGIAPNVILAGSKFIDAYRVDAKAGIQVQVMNGKNGSTLDGGNAELSFKGVPITWDPVMDDLQANLALSEAEWDKRAYFLNTRALHLRPAEGQDMIARNPPRVYNRYTHYWGLTWRGAMTISRPASTSVLWVA